MVPKNENVKFYASIPIKFFKSKEFGQFFFDLQYTIYSSKSKETEKLQKNLFGFNNNNNNNNNKSLLQSFVSKYMVICTYIQE
jgi:hypothetical protein